MAFSSSVNAGSPHGVGEAPCLVEIRGAFSGRKERRALASNPDLMWLHQQCSQEGLYPYYTGDRSKLTILDKQTYRRWKSTIEMERVKHPLRQRRRVVLIQPITHRHGNTTSGEEVGYGHTHICETVLDLLQEFCAAYFSEMEVKLSPSVDLSEIPRLTSRIHKTTNRRQFLVDDIIHFLSTRKLRKAYCILGVTIVDLYPGPEWNFVLGQACAEKGSGVFSFGRYFNSAVSLGGDGCSSEGEEPGHGVKIQAELEKEQIGNLWVLMRVMSHELCHLFGLAHCYYFQCAMNESNSIAEAATQPLFLCPVCLRKMNRLRQFNLEQRFSTLLEVTNNLRKVVGKVIEAGQSGLVKNQTLSENMTETELVPVAFRNEALEASRSRIGERREDANGKEEPGRGVLRGEEQDLLRGEAPEAIRVGERRKNAIGTEGREEQGRGEEQERREATEASRNGERGEGRRGEPGRDEEQERREAAEASRNGERGEDRRGEPGRDEERREAAETSRNGERRDNGSGMEGREEPGSCAEASRDRERIKDASEKDSQGKRADPDGDQDGISGEIDGGKQVLISEQLERMDGAILWLEEALRSIREFKQIDLPKEATL